MRSSASSCARQVLQLPLQKLTTTTSPRCSDMRTFSPDNPRATRSGAGWPTSSYFSAATALDVANDANASAANAACRAALGLTNKLVLTVNKWTETGRQRPRNPRIADLTMSTNHHAV